ncbi:hypothetical protein GCM10010203_45930 [Actinomadura yumaensis]
MLAYLQEWLKMRVGAAPVYVEFAGEFAPTTAIMTGVDEHGIVLEFQAGPKKAAYPWSAIRSVVRN